MGTFIAFIPGLVKSVLSYFKADPRKMANIIVLAIGWLTVVLQAMNLVIPAAIEILRNVLSALTV